jgi:hypothetical protein
LTINKPDDYSASACSFANQAAVNAAFATWLSGFNVSGGCNPQASYGTPVAPSLCGYGSTHCVGGTVTVTYHVTDNCGSSTNVTATFGIVPPPALVIGKPANMTTSACTYASQADLNAAFASWLAGFTKTGGCNPTATFGCTPTPPALCTGGTKTVTYTYSDLCESGSVCATFKVTAPPALAINKPSNYSASVCNFADQAALNTVFANWLNGFSVTGGCNPQGTYSTPVIPSLCSSAHCTGGNTGGVTTTVTYNVTDNCGSNSSVTATFTLIPSTALVIHSPLAKTVSACSYTCQSSLNSAFATWLAGFTKSGGCNTTATFGNTPTAPSLCTGGTTTVTYTYNSQCESGSVTSTFTVTPPPALIVNKPDDYSASACSFANQAAVNAAFAAWLSGFNVIGGCNPQASYGTPVAPSLCGYGSTHCVGGAVTVTYHVTDNCGSSTDVSATFGIIPPPALVIGKPANMTTSACNYASQADLNAAFASWLAGFTKTGGCNPTATFGCTPTPPALCTGGTKTVTYTYSDMCESGSVCATFKVTAPPALAINKPSNYSASVCNFADQAALNTVFANWLNGFNVTGGCNPQGTYGTPVIPSLCSSAHCTGGNTGGVTTTVT